MTIDLDDIMEVCSYQSIGITINGYIKIYNQEVVNYVDSEPVLLDDEFIESLLKRYKKMYLYDRSINWFNKIPEYITDLILEFNEKQNIELDKLHNGLKSLVIANAYTTYEKGFNQPINNLPNTLESLQIISTYFNQPIDFLPLSLKKLTISSNFFNQSLQNLPPNLEYLRLDVCDSYGSYKFLKDDLMNLPSELKKLYISKKIIPTNKEIKNFDKSEDHFENIMNSHYPNLNLNIF